MSKEANSTERALKLALEALENWVEYFPQNVDDIDMKAIAALREALAEQPAQSTAEKSELETVPANGGLLPAQQALDKMAENARELGLDYEPAQQEPVAWKLVPREPTHEMLKAMDECSTEGYDERLYAGHAASVYMAAVDAAPTPPAQPQQEPVVWMYVNKSTHETKFQKHMRDFVDHSLWSEVPLYGEPLANHEFQCVCGAVWCGDEMVHLPDKRPPAQRKPLTDEEIIKCWGQVSGTRYGYVAFARAIEAAHGIKENT